MELKHYSLVLILTYEFSKTPWEMRNWRTEHNLTGYLCSSIFIFNHLKTMSFFSKHNCFTSWWSSLLWLSRSIILKYTIQHFRSSAPKNEFKGKKTAECKLCCLQSHWIKSYGIYFTISEHRVLCSIIGYLLLQRTFI